MSDSETKSESSGKADLFHHGVITKLFPSNNMGLVRTESGREVPFSFDMVILVGEVKKPQDLRDGEEIGYDLGWTSNGLRVTKIKTYRQVPDAGGGHESEGEGGQGQNLPS